MKNTALKDAHVAMGARMVEFAAWNMPIQYSGIKEEHLAVRKAAGLFDVSHMGEIWVSGPGALALIQKLTPNDASVVKIGEAQYTAFLNERGGVIDDLIVYRTGEAEYMLCVNASNTEKDLAWVMKNAPGFDAKINDKSAGTGLIALQGPKSVEILSKLTDADLSAIKRFHFANAKVAGADCIVSRTGYTGEDGFEIFHDAGSSVKLWQALIDSGKPLGLMPAGLGCRDTLRLEMGYPLHGNDLDEDHTPYESNIGWICKPMAKDFIGKDALVGQKSAGVPEKVVGLELIDKGVPRHGYPVAKPDGAVVGIVTSGAMSLSNGVGIALARVKSEFAGEGSELAIVIRDQAKRARIIKPPFLKK